MRGTLIPLSQGCSQRGSSPQTRRGYLHPDFVWAASTDTWALQIQPSNPRGSLPHVYFKHSSILIKQHRKVNFRYGTSKIIIALKTGYTQILITEKSSVCFSESCLSDLVWALHITTHMGLCLSSCVAGANGWASPALLLLTQRNSYIEILVRKESFWADYTCYNFWQPETT